MPIYEFRCNRCGHTTSVFQRRITAPVSAACAGCGGTDLSRLVSRFSVLGADRAVGDALSGLEGVDESDPRSVARWARRMKAEGLGDDLGPEFDDMVERMEAGESLDEIGAENAADSDEGLD
ncbi:MAG: zinc ribbon domain-containing protein [Dehalococcoidia bacterium]